MGKNYFTPEQQEKLKNNKFTESCSQKSIRFTLEFKELFTVLYTEGLPAKEIFMKCGFDVEVLGDSRIENFTDRMKHFSTRDEKFDDLRKFNSGRYKKDPETAEEEIIMLKHKIALLTQELELLKKTRLLDTKEIYLQSRKDTY